MLRLRLRRLLRVLLLHREDAAKGEYPQELLRGQAVGGFASPGNQDSISSIFCSTTMLENSNR